MINYKIGLRKLKPIIICILALEFLIQAIPHNDPKVRIIGHPTIVLDPGHGGQDHGAKGSRSKEKDINLLVALRLKALISYYIPEAVVILTRETDEFIPLNHRTEIANSNQADLLISLHCNSNTCGSVQGAEAFIMGSYKSEDNLMIAARENLTDQNTNSTEEFNLDEDFIFLNQLQSHTQTKSLEFAENCIKELSLVHPGGSREVKQAGFVVLWKATMPSVLLEMGYINNIKDEDFLLSEEGQVFIASSMVKAILRFFEQKTQEISNASIPIQFNEKKRSTKTAN
ncbi:MAG: N-acetylmuramoyl-L-alanine amidase [Saprospiraceae bacterium]